MSTFSWKSWDQTKDISLSLVSGGFIQAHCNFQHFLKSPVKTEIWQNPFKCIQSVTQKAVWLLMGQQHHLKRKNATYCNQNTSSCSFLRLSKSSFPSIADNTDYLSNSSAPQYTFKTLPLEFKMWSFILKETKLIDVEVILSLIPGYSKILTISILSLQVTNKYRLLKLFIIIFYWNSNKLMTSL